MREVEAKQACEEGAWVSASIGNRKVFGVADQLTRCGDRGKPPKIRILAACPINGQEGTLGKRGQDYFVVHANSVRCEAELDVVG